MNFFIKKFDIFLEKVQQRSAHIVVIHTIIQSIEQYPVYPTPIYTFFNNHIFFFFLIISRYLFDFPKTQIFFSSFSAKILKYI